MDPEGENEDEGPIKSKKAKAKAQPELEVPPTILAFTRLLVSDADWARAKSKGKPPKPVADATTLRIVHASLVQRLSAYPTTLEDDRRVAADATKMQALSVNKRHALVVRLGEKRVVDAFRVLVERTLRDAEQKEEKEKKEQAASGKRKGGPDEKAGNGKKARK